MASGEGSDSQVHPKLPQTGSVGRNLGRALARWRRGGGEKNRRCARTRRGEHFGIDCQTLLSGGASVWVHEGKSWVALPVCIRGSHHYRRQKALLEPQTQRCAKGRGLCQGGGARETAGRKSDKRAFKIRRAARVSLDAAFILKAESGSESSRSRACKCGSGWREKVSNTADIGALWGTLGPFWAVDDIFEENEDRRGGPKKKKKDARPAVYFVRLWRQISPCVWLKDVPISPRWKKPPIWRLNIINIKLCWRHETVCFSAVGIPPTQCIKSELWIHCRTGSRARSRLTQRRRLRSPSSRTAMSSLPHIWKLFVGRVLRKAASVKCACVPP